MPTQAEQLFGIGNCEVKTYIWQKMGVIDMKPKSEISQELYQMMLDRGYQERFCDLVTQNLNTDFTAQRMTFLSFALQ